ncbi:hypothetical protein BGY98DRAFT_575583 [Russula aff. rugulosa BPL654]|nr:hypothetical protein BGY98DRAFT_575583 [Russula aff. rugulosa BPL654]
MDFFSLVSRVFVRGDTMVTPYMPNDTYLQLDAIPTVFSDPTLLYPSAVRFFFDGVRMLNEGYQKTGPGLFKVANFRRWMVLATGSHEEANHHARCGSNNYGYLIETP